MHASVYGGVDERNVFDVMSIPRYKARENNDNVLTAEVIDEGFVVRIIDLMRRCEPGWERGVCREISDKQLDCKFLGRSDPFQ